MQSCSGMALQVMAFGDSTEISLGFVPKRLTHFYLTNLGFGLAVAKSLSSCPVVRLSCARQVKGTKPSGARLFPQRHLNENGRYTLMLRSWLPCAIHHVRPGGRTSNLITTYLPNLST